MTFVRAAALALTLLTPAGSWAQQVAIRNNAIVEFDGLRFTVQTSEKHGVQVDGERRRYTVETGARWNYDDYKGSDKIRSEVAGNFTLAPGKLYSISYVQTIEDGPPLNNLWALAGQIHQVDPKAGDGRPADSRSPPFGIYLTRDAQGQEWHVITIRTSPSADPKVTPQTIEVGRVAVKRGQPCRWVHLYVDGGGKAGSLTSTCDGKPVANYRGPTGYVNDAPYWKEGVYLSERDQAGKTMPSWSLSVSYADLQIEAQ